VLSFSRLAGLGFWLALAAALFVALAPSRLSASDFGSDKIMHFTAFFALSVLACLAYGVRRPILLGVGLSAFGALIEVLQGLPLFHRDADVADWLVDTLAVVMVVSIAWILSVTFPQRAPTPRTRS
jgi:VanZ family protein